MADLREPEDSCATGAVFNRGRRRFVDRNSTVREASGIRSWTVQQHWGSRHWHGCVRFGDEYVDVKVLREWSDAIV